MATTPRTALILGATGLVGGYCLAQLLEENQYDQVTALVRHPLKLVHPKLNAQVVDFSDREALDRHTMGHDVFCCLGTTIRKAGSREVFRKIDLELARDLVAIAAANGARQALIVTAMGADPESRIFYNRIKGEVELVLATLPLRAIHFFRPALLLGSRREFRLAERLGVWLGRVIGPLMVGPLKAYRPIHAKTVARAMINIALAQKPGRSIFLNYQIPIIAK